MSSCVEERVSGRNLLIPGCQQQSFVFIYSFFQARVMPYLTERIEPLSLIVTTRVRGPE